MATHVVLSHDHRTFGAKGGVSAGMVGVVMCYENVGEPPATLCECRFDRCCFGRIDRRCRAG